MHGFFKKLFKSDIESKVREMIEARAKLAALYNKLNEQSQTISIAMLQRAETVMTPEEKKAYSKLTQDVQEQNLQTIETFTEAMFLLNDSGTSDMPPGKRQEVDGEICGTKNLCRITDENIKELTVSALEEKAQLKKKQAQLELQKKLDEAIKKADTTSSLSYKYIMAEAYRLCEAVKEEKMTPKVAEDSFLKQTADNLLVLKNEYEELKSLISKVYSSSMQLPPQCLEAKQIYENAFYIQDHFHEDVIEVDELHKMTVAVRGSENDSQLDDLYESIQKQGNELIKKILYEDTSNHSNMVISAYDEMEKMRELVQKRYQKIEKLYESVGKQTGEISSLFGEATEVHEKTQRYFLFFQDAIADAQMLNDDIARIASLKKDIQDKVSDLAKFCLSAVNTKGLSADKDIQKKLLSQVTDIKTCCGNFVLANLALQGRITGALGSEIDSKDMGLENLQSHIESIKSIESRLGSFTFQQIQARRAIKNQIEKLQKVTGDLKEKMDSYSSFFFSFCFKVKNWWLKNVMKKAGLISAKALNDDKQLNNDEEKKEVVKKVKDEVDKQIVSLGAKVVQDFSVEIKKAYEEEADTAVDKANQYYKPN
jgi:hypothetical protein